MGFEVSERAKEINERLEAFMEEHIYPRERDYDEFTNDQNNLFFCVFREIIIFLTYSLILIKNYYK